MLPRLAKKKKEMKILQTQWLRNYIYEVVRKNSIHLQAGIMHELIPSESEIKHEILCNNWIQFRRQTSVN